MTRLKLLTIALLHFTLFSIAQEKNLTGTVKDNTGELLPGVNINIKGTKIGSFSDFDGNYKITISKGQILVFSFLGYKTKEIIYNDESQLNIIMETDTSQLDEVVVVGYGTQRRKDITGSVVSLKIEESLSQQVQTVDQVLQGRVAGVQMVGNTGSPNSGISIKIRGGSSLRANNEPLYVVDGVLISSAGEDALNATGSQGSLPDTQNGLNGINPRDIENIEILKDASATAIYGSRGANGVVIITTKRGKKGKSNVSAFVTTSVNSIDNEISVLSGIDFANYRNEALVLNGENPRYIVDNNQVFVVRNDILDEEPAELANYQDRMYTTGFSSTFGGSVSGAGEKTNHFLSFGYNNLNGVTETANLRNANFRLNLGSKVSKNFRVDTRISAYHGVGTMFQQADQFGGNRAVVGSALARNPILGDNDDNDNSFDPIESMRDYDDKSKETRIIGLLSLRFKLPIEGLSYTVRGGGNLRYKDRRRWYGLATFQGEPNNGLLGMSNLAATQFNIDNLFNYNRTFNKVHKLNGLIGTTYEGRTFENQLYSLIDFSNLTFRTEQPIYGQQILDPNQIVQANENLLSFMARANYSLKDKYIFTATFRADGSSKFQDENRWGYFPSFSGAWIVSEESFIKSIKSISNLKFRAGWGQVGNQAVSPYQTLSGYSANQYAQAGNGLAIAQFLSNVANPSLKWETTVQTNIGLDYGFLDDRFTGSIEYYMKKTNDLITLAPIPGSSGFSRIQTNKGSLASNGLEIALNNIIVDNENFKFEIGGNIAFTKNEIQDTKASLAPIYINGQEEMRAFELGNLVGNRGPYNVFIDGEEPGLFYGFQTDGIYQEGDVFIDGAQPGDVKFIDTNGDNEINISDRTIIGNPNPDFVYGLNMNISYKRFNLSANFDGVYGNDIINTQFETLDIAEGSFSNITVNAYQQAWRPNAPSNTYPRLGAFISRKGGPVDRMVSDGSYFRLNNLTLGYDIPVGDFASKAQIYIAGTNLFTITDYTGYTPVLTSYLNDPLILGVDNYNPPNSRIITLGLTINF